MAGFEVITEGQMKQPMKLADTLVKPLQNDI